jgi:transcriptional regulator with XRE-family HTH domain
MATTNQMAGMEVRRSRIDRGWTYEDMSREIYNKYGVRYQTSARTIWRVESGHKPSVRRQFAIAAVLGLVPSQLWDHRRTAVSA